MMSYREAQSIAHDPVGEHATVSLDCAERVLKERNIGGRDRDAYIQLADLKARLQRIIGWTERALTSEHNPDDGTNEAINRIALNHKV